MPVRLMSYRSLDAGMVVKAGERLVERMHEVEVQAKVR
jgi:hypothetical protein